MAKRKPDPRRAAALKGWRTRRRKERERSEAAKRGWETRKKNERKRKREARERKEKRAKGPGKRKPTGELREAEPEVITRRTYKRKGERQGARIEVVSRGPLKADMSNVKSVKINARTYTRPKDILALRSLIQGSS